MSVISVEGQQGIVEILDQTKGIGKRTSIQCDRDIIINFPALNSSLVWGNVVNGSGKADYVSGVLAPNEVAFTGSNWALSWSSQYIVSGSGTVNFHGSNVNLLLNPSNMTMTCQTLATGDLAFETVTVPAGTFRALKVVCIGQGNVTGTVNGNAIAGSLSAQSTQWFAPYIGMVKMKSDYTTLQVFGVNIPIDTEGLGGQVELQNYKQGP